MILFENIVFSRALGSSTAVFLVKRKYNMFYFGLIMTTIIVISMFISFFINPIIRANTSYSYYIEPVVCVLIIGAVYITTLIGCNHFLEKRRKEILEMIHLSSFNCAVLGSLLLAPNIAELSLGGYIGIGIGVGFGFTFVVYLLSLAYEQLNSVDIPPAYRGLPITLIYIGIISLAVYGLIGHELPF